MAITALPEDLRLVCMHPAEVVLEALVRAMFPAVPDDLRLQAWVLQTRGGAQMQGNAQDDARAPRESLLTSVHNAGIDRQEYLKLEFEGGLTLTAALQGNGWMVSSLCTADQGLAAMSRWLVQAALLARRLAAAVPIEAAEIERMPSAGGRFVPSPPLARTRHLWLTTDAQVAEHYPQAAQDFADCWDGEQQCGDQRLQWRALHCVDDPAWVAAVLPGQLKLARRAQPGATHWQSATLVDWNRRWLAAPHEHLGFVGYDPVRGSVEFAAAPVAGGLSIGELQSLYELRAAGQDGRGRPVREVRVVFAREDLALTDQVVLADLGILALCQQADGSLAPPRAT